MSGWTDERVEMLVALWNATPQISTAEIARRIGSDVTKNAVVGRAGRMGLPARPSPILREAMAWTEARKAELRRMRAAGWSIERIARSLRTDNAAVRRMLDAMGLPLRLGHDTRPRAPKPAAAPKLAPACRGALGRAVQMSRGQKRPALRGIGQPFHHARYQVVSGEVYKACCWPLWGDDAARPIRAARFCEAAPARISTPYCEAHARIAYRQVEPPVEQAA